MAANGKHTLKTHRARLIKILTDIAESAENTTPQRIEAIKLAMLLKSRASRSALTRIDKEIARLIGSVESAGKADANPA